MIELGYEPPAGWRDWIAERRTVALARLDALAGYPALRRRYRRASGFPLNLRAPLTVGDKINWRKIHDRNPVFPTIADKLRMRAHVADRLGAEAAALFPRLHLVADCAGALALETLPGGLVVKANHASGWIIMLREGSNVDCDWVRRVCGHWLRRTYAPQKHEWAYLSIPRRILVEEMLLDAGGRLPDDVKLHVYDGICRRCTIEAGREQGRLVSRHYTPDWQPYDLANAAARQAGTLAPDRPAPAGLAAMRRIAERLAAGLDYLRVDFLDLGDRFTLTELTLYPASGHGGPIFEREVEVGKYWRNPRWQEPRAA